MTKLARAAVVKSSFRCNEDKIQAHFRKTEYS
jgi:hypothetical protein